MKGRAMNIGVLALQGAFAEHIRALDAIPGVYATEIRQAVDFHPGLSGIIIPGGESTVMAKLLVDLGLLEPLTRAVREGMPVFGTCAGLILLASDVEGSPASRIGQLDVSVKRNAYGRQLDSFDVVAEFDRHRDVPMVFIRAPGLTRVGPNVTVLAEVNGYPVAVRQGNILATAFHPELTGDTRIHQYFLDMVA